MKQIAFYIPSAMMFPNNGCKYPMVYTGWIWKTTCFRYNINKGLILFILLCSGCSRHTDTVKVSHYSDYGFANEPSIAVNPRNPDEIMIACNIDRAYYSKDRGESWKAYHITSPVGVWGDFSVVCDTNGNFLPFHLSSPGGYRKNKWLDRIVCQGFDKTSKTWRIISYAGDSLSGTFKDKPVAIVNKTNNEVALAWTEYDSVPGKANTGKSYLLFSTSGDVGRTWSASVRLNKIPGDASLGDSTATAVTLCTNTSGDYFAVWPRLDTLWMNRFDHIRHTWNDAESFVAMQPGGWRFFLPGLKWCNGWPSVSCRISGASERLYVCWGAKPDDSLPSAIYYAFSDDEGLHWSDAQQILSASKHSNLFFPVGKVDESSGAYGVLAYETADENKMSMRPVLFISRDNTGYFQKNDCLDENFTADTHEFLGDYISIGAQKGIFYPVWTVITDPFSEITMARIPVTGCSKK